MGVTGTTNSKLVTELGAPKLLLMGVVSYFKNSSSK